MNGVQNKALKLPVISISHVCRVVRNMASFCRSIYPLDMRNALNAGNWSLTHNSLAIAPPSYLGAIISSYLGEERYWYDTDGEHRNYMNTLPSWVSTGLRTGLTVMGMYSDGFI